jgi:hypothetical protein
LDKHKARLSAFFLCSYGVPETEEQRLWLDDYAALLAGAK